MTKDLVSGCFQSAIFVADDRDIDAVHELIKIDWVKTRSMSKNALKEEYLVQIPGFEFLALNLFKARNLARHLFVDIDRVHERKPELVDKYLYVRLTRATTFLGVTWASTLPPSLKVVEEQFGEGSWADLLDSAAPQIN